MISEKTRRTIQYSEEVEAAIKLIREKGGYTTDAAAIRAALLDQAAFITRRSADGKQSDPESIKLEMGDALYVWDVVKKHLTEKGFRYLVFEGDGPNDTITRSATYLLICASLETPKDINPPSSARGGINVLMRKRDPA